MHKTTVYLDPRELRQLKHLALRSGKGSAAQLIREAVRGLLADSARTVSFKFLRKVLRRRGASTRFGDPVAYQRALRKEWA